MVRMPNRSETPKRVQDLEKDLQKFVASVARSFQKSADSVFQRVMDAVASMFWTRTDADNRFAFKSHTHDGGDIVSGTVVRPTNNTSSQSNQFLGGSFTGTTGTFSGGVAAASVTSTGDVTSTGGRGVFPTGVQSTGARNNQVTTGYVAAYIDSGGNLGYAPSTRASKDIGAEYAVDMTRFLGMKLYNWQYKNGGMKGIGPIADDLELAGLTEFLTYSMDGQLQGLRYESLTMGLWSAYVQSRTSTLAEFNKRMVQSKTVTNMTALSIGGTKSYTITWDKPFSDSTYAVVPYVYSSSGVLLSGVSAASLPSSRTTTQCVVQVAAGVALLAGQTLVVEGIHV